jgi:hypothetical protein
MHTLPTIPPLDAALVDALDKRFPERCARPGMTLEDIWLEAGKREVIRFLQDQLRQQSDNILERKL